jgi:hypothetical protein
MASMARRGIAVIRSKRPADMRLSTSPLDAFMNPIRASIKPRASGPEYYERTSRMLMLVQLHANGRDDIHAYTHVIPRLARG